MFYILASVIASVSVSVQLKLARRWNMDLAQIIAFNYVMALALSWFLLAPNQAMIEVFADPALPWPLLIVLGLILPSLFIIMGKAVQQAGIIRSDAAQRLSLFLPILAAFTIFGETTSSQKAISLCIAFIALFCLIYRSRSQTANQYRSASWLLLLVWVGYGLVDILFKQLAKVSIAFNVGLIISFSLALIFMLIYLLIKRTQWRRNEILFGLLLGAFNFCNIYFYISAHRHYHEAPTLVFTSMNIGVICLGTIIGALCFKEKINRFNILGIILAICAIMLLFGWTS